MDLLTRLRRCCQQRELGIREESGLTEAEHACLNAITAPERLSVGVLCDRMGLSRSRGGRVVDRLVQRGLLERRAAGGDRRVSHVIVTSEGRALQRRVSECIDACEAALHRRLNESQTRAAQSGLAVMLEAMEER
jgi:DNA-binding MarR family transcriptional regulator